MKPRWYWLLTLAYWALIFTLTHLPPRVVQQPTGRDKVQHMSAYGVLGILLFATLQATGWTARQACIGVLGMGMAYGVIDELTQPLFRRSAELADWFADVAGLLVALLICLGVGYVGKKKEPQVHTDARG